jgi:hypothetical protein
LGNDSDDEAELDNTDLKAICSITEGTFSLVEEKKRRRNYEELHDSYVSASQRRRIDDIGSISPFDVVHPRFVVGSIDERHMIIPINLNLGGISIDTVALIDSGSSSSFVSRDMAEVHGFPLWYFRVLVTLRLIKRRKGK